ncbi:hypothetical protein GLYMA_04G036050v4 [Glycine max]|nr:hypothetical protein GLYMA_04G036050v4 [Glycine max]KAH1109607.1 hypothetical protein GYH30_008826 [Glycine max]
MLMIVLTSRMLFLSCSQQLPITLDIQVLFRTKRVNVKGMGRFGKS